MPTYEEKMIEAAPIAYWRAGEAAGAGIFVDEMGSHNATANAGVTFEKAGAIYQDTDTAAAFTGLDDSGGTVNAALLPTTTGVAWSIEAWVRWTFSGSSPVVFAQYTVSHADRGMPLSLLTSDNKARVWHAGSTLLTSSTAITENQWTHLAVTCNSSGRLRIYQNGLKVAEAATGFVGRKFTDTATILGARVGIDTAPIELDELLVYDREVTDAELLDHYTWGVSGVPDISENLISGVVNLDGSPVVATLRLYLTTTGALVEEVQSDVLDGAYVFGAGAISLSLSFEYFVMCHYGADTRPLAHGPVTPIAAGP